MYSATVLLTQYQTQCLYNPKTQGRRLHRVPQLAHSEAFTKDGVLGMLSADGFDMAWTQYHSHLVDRLNKLTAGIPSVASIHSTVLQVHQPLLTSTFKTLHTKILPLKTLSLRMPVNRTPPPSSTMPAWPGPTTNSSPPSPRPLPKCPPTSQPKSATPFPPPNHSEPPLSRPPTPCSAPASSGSSGTNTDPPRKPNSQS